MRMKKNRVYIAACVGAVTAAVISFSLAASSSPVQADERDGDEQFGTCAELARALETPKETQRTYDEEAGAIYFSTGEGTYLIDVNDEACAKDYPVVGAAVADVLQVITSHDKSICETSLKEIATFDPAWLKDPKATFESARGPRPVQAYVAYVHELCEKVGISVQ